MLEYEVRVIYKSGKQTTIACSGRNVDATALRESRRRAVTLTEVHLNGDWVRTYVNGKLAFAES